MELINGTRMVSGYTSGTDVDGRERLVVVLKGTFRFQGRDCEAVLDETTQLPLATADSFTGSPGSTAPVHEADFAPFKPRCDVLLQGRAHAPGARPVRSLPVRMRVAEMEKTLVATGTRRWRQGLLGLKISEPDPFLTMPLGYDHAFGGADSDDPKEATAPRYPANPAGRGWRPHTRRGLLVGQNVCTTEEPGRGIERPDGTYRPMAFGPIGRWWMPRRALAGTYDQHWIDEIFPFLPPDIDPLFHQAAPPDQQIDHPQGGEQVELTHLTPEGHERFHLPRLSVPITFIAHGYGESVVEALLDTIILEPDSRRIVLTWRASMEVPLGLLHMRQVIIGQPSRDAHRTLSIQAGPASGPETSQSSRRPA